MLGAMIACALWRSTSSESVASSSSSVRRSYKSMYVSRNGVVRQHLGVDRGRIEDHRTMRRSPVLPCADGPCPNSLLDEARKNLETRSLGQSGNHSLIGEAQETSFEASNNSWGYDDQDKWQSKNSTWTCNGTRQSPIALNDLEINTSAPAKMVSLINKFNFTADFSALFVKNNGKSIQINAPEDSNLGVFTLPDGPYNALHFNFHKGTEHVINGNMLHLMEMHIVFQKQGSTGFDDLAVMGIMLQDKSSLGSPRNISKQTDFFDSIRCRVDGGVPMFGQNCTMAQAEVDLTDIFEYELQGQYFHYEGSLTTPPCTEGVHWYVLKRPAAINLEFVKAFGERFGANNRNLQARNGRWISLNNWTNPPEQIITYDVQREFPR